MQSLKDKLLKAGLVTAAQAQKVEAEKSARPARPARPGRGAPRDEAPIPKLPPLAGSKEANRQLARAQLELDRKIRARVLEAQVAPEAGAATFHFVTRKGKLRRLELSEAQHKQLSEGALAVVERPDPDMIEHALVPAEVALELKALSERCVRFLNKDGAAVGFLSDDELQRRLAEPETPDVPDVSEGARAEDGEVEGAPAEGSAAEASAAAGGAAEAEGAADAGPAEPETWLTVRRAR